MPTMVQVGTGCLEGDTPLSETMVDYHLIDAHDPPGLDELMVGALHANDTTTSRHVNKSEYFQTVLR